MRQGRKAGAAQVQVPCGHGHVHGRQVCPSSQASCAWLGAARPHPPLATTTTHPVFRGPTWHRCIHWKAHSAT